MPRISRDSHRVQQLMKKSTAQLIEAHRRTHPVDGRLYKRGVSKRRLAREVARPQWWPQQDFPATLFPEEKKQKKKKVAKKQNGNQVLPSENRVR